jgi:capsular exopolysaccharide synthesis family protein
MSHIFDALQRSEAERTGTDFRTLSAATELLQIAERGTAAEREKVVQPEITPATPESSTAAEPTPNGTDVDQLSQFQSLRVLASPQSRLVCLTDKESLAAEKFRFLGVRLRQLRQSRPLKKVLITSAIPEEGKSMVAANLACTLARRAPRRTLLVEGDLRRPSLSQMFGLGRLPGICEWLQDGPSPMTSIYYLEGPGFWMLPAGSTPNNPLELLQSGRVSELMDQLSTWFDWIIIDSPPVLPLADTSVWTRSADGILLVTRQGTTEERQLQRALEALESKKLIGALLNCTTNPAHSDYYYHYRPPAASPADGGPTK